MKVLVDGGNSGSGGYLRYLSGVLAADLPDDVEVRLVCSPQIARAVGPLDRRVEVIAEPALSAPRRRTRLGWWQRRWPGLVRAYQPDVVLHPTGLVRGRSGGVPTVAIHHVMAPFVLASYRLYGLSRTSAEFLFWRARLLRSFRRADGVVFHADYTRRHVIRQARSVRRTALVRNAVPPGFGAGPRPARLDLQEPVSLLCVSTLYLFKYQWNVVDAVVRLRDELGIDLRISFVGGGEPRARRRLLQRIQECAATAYATVLEVAPEQMPQVYANADVFVFPSADETWPITLLEAMASGLPIACSNRMAMPAMLGDAGTYFDPEDPASIAAALRPLLVDAQVRDRAGTLAPRYAAEYTWARSAADLFAFLRRVAEEARP